MSLTCQLRPEPETVTANCPVFLLTPFVEVIFWLMVTMNVMLPEPNARSELMLAVPVETCLARSRGPATPGVAYARASTPASWGEIRFRMARTYSAAFSL